MGCTSEKTIELVVNENPVAAFHGTDTLVVPPGYILDAGSGLAHYKWNTGETTQSIEVIKDGSYRVDMETVAGCVGVDSVYIVISEEILSDCLFIPNAFTPNNDGLNDTFKAVSRCPSLSYFRMQIFNRWGEMLYESDDIGKGWDGRKNGTPCPGDVYVYRIVYRANGVITEVNEDTVVLGNVVIVK
jgi:gliding motility-associated-like protein